LRRRVPALGGDPIDHEGFGGIGVATFRGQPDMVSGEFGDLVPAFLIAIAP
jgi:hypothetical protein